MLKFVDSKVHSQVMYSYARKSCTCAIAGRMVHFNDIAHALFPMATETILILMYHCLSVCRH